MPVIPKINGVEYSNYFMKVHCDRNLENQDADRATILLANPYSRLTGQISRGDIVRMEVQNEVRSCPKSSSKKNYVMFTGCVYSIQDGPKEIEIVATCRITSLSKNVPDGFQAPAGATIAEDVQLIINKYNEIAADWEQVIVAEIWQCEIKKDQLVRDLNTTFLDLLDQCCEASGGFYWFDEEGLFHFSEPGKQVSSETIDITPVNINPVACYTQLGYKNSQTVIGTSENEPGTHPAEQDRHAPVMATYDSPTIADEGEAKVVAPPLYLPYITTTADAQRVAKNMVANYAQYKNATQDLELINAIVRPLDRVKYATGLQYVRGEKCGKVIPSSETSQTKGLVRRAVVDILAKGWSQKLETCAPPTSGGSDSEDQSSSSTSTKMTNVKTFGQPPYAWTKDGYNFYFGKSELYNQMNEELNSRNQTETPNSWIFVNPDTFNPSADSSTWEIARFGQDTTPPYGWKTAMSWNASAVEPGDIDRALGS
ncbi:MAG: hypothetical protein ACE14P_06220 [Methanotrichaceae archaeon]